MGVITEWRQGSRFRADPQKCADEILEICDDIGSATPKDILEKARDETTELHKCFTWDDSVAAERYRLEEARLVVRHLVIKEEVIPTDRPQIRLLQKTDSESGYKPIEMILHKEDEYKGLLKRAYEELRTFKRKYAMLKELQEIFDLIG